MKIPMRLKDVDREVETAVREVQVEIVAVVKRGSIVVKVGSGGDVVEATVVVAAAAGTVEEVMMTL